MYSVFVSEQAILINLMKSMQNDQGQLLWGAIVNFCYWKKFFVKFFPD